MITARKGQWTTLTSLHIFFFYFPMAFDMVNREMLWKLLCLYACPDIFVEIDGINATVSIGGSEYTFWFHKESNKAESWCKLFSTLPCCSPDLHVGLCSQGSIPVLNGNLFNLACLLTNTKCFENVIQDLLYADDADLISLFTSKELQQDSTWRLISKDWNSLPTSCQWDLYGANNHAWQWATEFCLQFCLPLTPSNECFWNLYYSDHHYFS